MRQNVTICRQRSRRGRRYGLDRRGGFRFYGLAATAATKPEDWSDRKTSYLKRVWKVDLDGTLFEVIF